MKKNTSTCTVTFNQAGNSSYATAPPVKQTTTAKLAIPDLVVTSLSEPPGAVEPGASFPVTDTVSNQGIAEAKTSKVQYYLSLNTSKGASDTLLTPSRSVSKLAVGATSSGTVTVEIPTTVALGAYHVLACADDKVAVAESNESNNCRASVGTVQVSRPDLRATVSNPPATGAQGSSFTVHETTHELRRSPCRQVDDGLLPLARSDQESKCSGV